MEIADITVRRGSIKWGGPYIRLLSRQQYGVFHSLGKIIMRQNGQWYSALGVWLTILTLCWRGSTGGMYALPR